MTHSPAAEVFGGVFLCSSGPYLSHLHQADLANVLVKVARAHIHEPFSYQVQSTCFLEQRQVRDACIGDTYINTSGMSPAVGKKYHKRDRMRAASKSFGQNVAEGLVSRGGGQGENNTFHTFSHFPHHPGNPM